MTIESRRKFIRGAGLLGVLATGVMAAKTASSTPVVINNNTHIHNKTPEVDPKILKLIEESNPAVLQLQTTYGELTPLTDTDHENVYIANSLYGYSKYIPGTEKHVFVKLIAGPDGELYLGVDGQWKKVLTTI
jgi:hypothetical protein